jgi:hypothetical protein
MNECVPHPQNVDLANTLRARAESPPSARRTAPVRHSLTTPQIPAAVLSAIVAARAAHATADLRAPAPDGAPVDVFAHSSVALGTGMTSSAGVGSRTAGTGSRTAGARSSLTTSRGLPSLRLTTRDLAPEPFGCVAPPGPCCSVRGRS